jgi:hypothetical protein
MSSPPTSSRPENDTAAHCGLAVIGAVHVSAAVTWLTARTAGKVAPAYYVVVAAVVSLLTILTISETAGRPLPRGVPDEMFQSEPDVHRAAATGERRSYS